MRQWWREQFGRRPWWMNALMIFCAYMAFVYVPWDILFKPAARDVEVWFGVAFRGGWAKLLAPVHWAVYMAGAYGFWRTRAWMWPWASIYVAQVAFSSLLWSILHVGGVGGWFFGVVSGAGLAGLVAALWQARDQFAPPRLPLRARYGEWALITGASAGIGADFARALARDGLNCVLSARRDDRLRALAAELESTYRVSTRVVPAALDDPAGVDALLRGVADLEIGVLVNNAGVGYAGRFDKQDTDRLRAMVQLNCIAPVVLTSRLLPGMRARGRGAVIITGSVAGAQSTPYMAAYSATKAFDRHLGEALWAELLGTGIDVLVLEPGATETEFQAVAGEMPHAAEPASDVVAVALDALGRQPSVISGWLNWARAQSARLAPRSLVTLVAARVMEAWTPTDMR